MSTGTLTETVCFGQMILILSNNKRSRWVCCETKNQYAEKHQRPNFQYGGGSMMLWACFSYQGPGSPVRVQAIMTTKNIRTEKFHQTINLLPWPSQPSELNPIEKM
ncbi:hypothetical protein ILYODFUR_001754 [Ilyodon furcidens]|uniref:Uncharacterized protein n=1 Tax=Ilyodon furcidens TaxID=33524 RepID=A0ABV0THS9_9TELE